MSTGGGPQSDPLLAAYGPCAQPVPDDFAHPTHFAQFYGATPSLVDVVTASSAPRGRRRRCGDRHARSTRGRSKAAAGRVKLARSGEGALRLSMRPTLSRFMVGSLRPTLRVSGNRRPGRVRLPAGIACASAKWWRCCGQSSGTRGDPAEGCGCSRFQVPFAGLQYPFRVSPEAMARASRDLRRSPHVLPASFRRRPRARSPARDPTAQQRRRPSGAGDRGTQARRARAEGKKLAKLADSIATGRVPRDARSRAAEPLPCRTRSRQLASIRRDAARPLDIAGRRAAQLDASWTISSTARIAGSHRLAQEKRRPG
jgi:hypothetical protein